MSIGIVIIVVIFILDIIKEIKEVIVIKRYCDFCNRELDYHEKLGDVHCGMYISADEVCQCCLNDVRKVLVGWQKSRGYCSQELLGKDYGVKEFKALDA